MIDGQRLTSPWLTSMILVSGLLFSASAHANFITGFAWNDLNVNGIQDVGEPGISNVVVQLFEFPSSNIVEGVVTDADGIYIFTDVANGSYFLRFFPPSTFSITTNNAGGDPTLDSDINSAGQTPPFVFDGTPVENLDAGFFQLQPGISLTKLANDAPDGEPLFVTNGTIVTYTYIVTNTGNVHLSFIGLFDDVLFPEGGDDVVELANCFDPENPEFMAPGDVIVFTTQTVINASVTNIAFVEALVIDFKTCDLLGDFDPVTAEDDAVVIVVTPGFTLEKDVTEPEGRAAAIGESIVFTITIENTGDVGFVTVPVEDTYDTSFLAFVGAVPPTIDTVNDGIINWANVGPLPIGASTSLVVTFTAVASSPNAQTNRVVASPTTPPNVPGTPPQTNDAPYEIRNPGFGLIKSVISPSGRAAGVGEDIVFSISVLNTGDVPLVTVPLIDTYDSSFLDFQSASPSADSVGGGVLVWNDLGSLIPGASTSVVVTFTALASTDGFSETNTVVATPTTPPELPPVPPQTNDVPYEISNPGFLLTKTILSPLGRAAAVGEPIQFSLNIENTGDVSLVTVPVQDTFLPAFLGYESAVPPADDIAPGVLTWNDIGPLPVGSSTSIVVTFTALATTDGFAETNLVVASPTTPPDQPPVPPQTNEVPYEISNPGYGLSKTLDAPIGRSAEVGETLQFTLTVVNTGDVTLVTVPLTDTFEPAFLLFNNAVPAPDASVAGSLVWNNLGPLPAGASTSVIVQFTAVASSGGGDRTNRVVAAPTTPPGQPPVPPRTNEVPYQISNPGYALIKTLISPVGRAAALGEPLQFSLSVINTGDVVLVTIPLVDTFDASLLEFASSVPPANNVAPGLVGWVNLGPLNPGATTSVVVNFTAIGSTVGENRTNTVVATPTTPPEFPPVPPRTNETPFRISDPSYLLTKSVISPVGRAAEVGEAIQFSLTVQNNGDVDLVTVPLVDFYNSAILEFVSSVPPVNNSLPGSLVWNNVGPLPAGASTSIVVNTIALASTVGASETNRVVAAPTTPPDEPPVPPQTNDVPYRVSNPGYDLIKTLVSPLGRPAVVGEPVVFSLSVVNTGDVVLVTVPLEDLYDPAYFAFSTATPPPSDPAPGALAWDNIGPLPPGASTGVVVTFTALQVTVAPETNAVVARPTTPPDEPPVPPRTNDVPYEIMTLTIGDTVWLDLNGNGIPDENLAVQGLNGVTIRLLDVTGGITNLVATTVTFSNTNWRGYYIFTNLPFANYVVEVDLSSVPSANPPGGGFPGLPPVPLIPTTPLRYTIPPIPPSGIFLDADFGFFPASPTAVELVSFTGTPTEEGILLEWETAAELNNLGFHLYRAGDVNGSPVRITQGLIDGMGTGEGQAYAWLDKDVESGQTYYYWLDDIEFDMTTKRHGPVRVSLAAARAGVIASLNVKESGLYVLPARTLANAGIELTAVSPSRLQVLVGDEPVAAYILAWGASLRPNDAILFYVDASIGSGAEVALTEMDDPVHMLEDYAGPTWSDGQTWVGSMGNDQWLRIPVSPAFSQYFVSGLTTGNAWVLDISRPMAPVLLFGAETFWDDHGTGIYFSLPDPAATEAVVVGDHGLKIIDRVKPGM
ncbi:MAG TPA: SdrD B-like domain-containing protein [Kiritimatiellia bacterium]|nr:SdrD B-like domain-containing protein [Kiritimatiellia bacterium]